MLSMVFEKRIHPPIPTAAPPTTNFLPSLKTVIPQPQMQVLRHFQTATQLETAEPERETCSPDQYLL